MTTEQVLTHHLEAFGTGDIDALMDDYTDDSIFIVPDETLRGRDAIRQMFTFLIENMFIPESYEFEMKRVEIVDEIAYIVWQATSDRLRVPLGTDTFVVRDGKIALQTFAAHVELEGGGPQ